jgi:hypothetical protein
LVAFSKPTDPSDSVAAIASKAAWEMAILIIGQRRRKRTTLASGFGMTNPAHASITGLRRSSIELR